MSELTPREKQIREVLTGRLVHVYGYKSRIICEKDFHIIEKELLALPLIGKRLVFDETWFDARDRVCEWISKPLKELEFSIWRDSDVESKEPLFLCALNRENFDELSSLDKAITACSEHAWKLAAQLLGVKS